MVPEINAWAVVVATLSTMVDSVATTTAQAFISGTMLRSFGFEMLRCLGVYTRGCGQGRRTSRPAPRKLEAGRGFMGRTRLLRELGGLVGLEPSPVRRNRRGRHLAP